MRDGLDIRGGGVRPFLVRLLVAVVVVGCSGHISRSADPSGDGASGPRSTTDSPGVTPDPSAGAAGSASTDAGSSADPPPTSMEPACTDLGTVGAPLPLRRLNATHVQRTVADVLGVTATVAVTDEKLFTYRSNVSAALDASSARGYLDFAESAAAAVDLAHCGSESCVPWLLDEVGLRLFRRPLDDDQRARYTALAEAGGADGPRWVLEAMLQSPSFLYLDEVADDDGYLDDYGIAARLSIALWGQNPDAALLALAEAGELSTPAQVRDAAESMLADPRAEEGLRDFVDQWLELHRLDDADTRPDLAALGADTVTALRDEPVRFVHALLEQGASLTELLTASDTPRSDALQTLYGDDIVSSSAETFSLDPERRAGILTLPGVMAALSHAGATSPTLRGFAVLSSFLCTPPAPPPAGVNVTLPDVGPDATARERLEAHFSSDACSSCHRSMDGIGFAFERIDWLGQSRDEEANGQAIDDESTFGLGGEEVSVQGAVELARTLAESEDVADCIARQWARYASGLKENADAACLLERLGEEIAATDGLHAMMLTYLGSDWFRRAPEVTP